jgi:hypothetical protein
MRWYTWLVAALVFVASLVILPGGGTDWSTCFTEAATRWWDAPWKEGMSNPPYAALMLWPLGVLGSRLATAIVNSASVLLLARLARRWDGSEWAVLPVLLSPVGIYLLGTGQIDVLVLSGVLLPEAAGVLVYVVKPQTGLWIAAAHWRKLLGWPLVVGIVVGVITLVIWGWWPIKVLNGAGYFTGSTWNAALWPWFIPAGIWCAWRAWKREDERYGVAASPLLFPYLGLSSYAGVVLLLVIQWPRVMAAAAVLTSAATVVLLVM